MICDYHMLQKNLCKRFSLWLVNWWFFWWVAWSVGELVAWLVGELVGWLRSWLVSFWFIPIPPFGGRRPSINTKSQTDRGIWNFLALLNIYFLRISGKPEDRAKMPIDRQTDRQRTMKLSTLHINYIRKISSMAFRICVAFCVRVFWLSVGQLV